MLADIEVDVVENLHAPAGRAGEGLKPRAGFPGEALP